MGVKGFCLDVDGDVVIEKNDIKLAYDTELLMQKIRQVLNTNRGEWWLDVKEGIPVQKVLKKNPSLAMVRDYVRNAIVQVDASLQMTRCEVTTQGRVLNIAFEVSGKSGTAAVDMEV